MADGVKDALYARGTLAFLMPCLGSMSIGMYKNDKVAIDLGGNPLSPSNSKHINVRHYFLREMAASGDMFVQYLRSKDQHADILTKAKGTTASFWAGVRFQYFPGLLVDPTILSRL